MWSPIALPTTFIRQAVMPNSMPAVIPRKKAAMPRRGSSFAKRVTTSAIMTPVPATASIRPVGAIAPP